MLISEMNISLAETIAMICTRYKIQKAELAEMIAYDPATLYRLSTEPDIGESTERRLRILLSYAENELVKKVAVEAEK